jgi:hypothetical protein
VSSLSEIAGDVVDITTPINREISASDILMKATEAPIGYAIHAAVF